MMIAFGIQIVWGYFRNAIIIYIAFRIDISYIYIYPICIIIYISNAIYR